MTVLRMRVVHRARVTVDLVHVKFQATKLTGETRATYRLAGRPKLYGSVNNQKLKKFLIPTESRRVAGTVRGACAGCRVRDWKSLVLLIDPS